MDTSSECMCIVEDQFVLWIEVLDIFGGFSSYEFSFLNGNNGWVSMSDDIM